MQRSHLVLITSFIVLFGWSCSSSGGNSWTDFVPENTSFVIIPDNSTGFANFINAPYVDLLEDLTGSSLQQFISFEQEDMPEIRLTALAVFPATSTDSQIIWVTQSSVSLKKWAQRFYKPFQQNYYNFGKTTVHRIPVLDSYLYAAQQKNWILFSYSSIALEAALRSFTGKEPAMQFTAAPAPGQFILNTGKVDLWTEQFAAVTYRPSLVDVFEGFSASNLNFSENGEGITLHGVLKKNEKADSPLASALTSENKAVQLDRYVAANASGFAVLHSPSPAEPILPEKDLLTPLDLLLTTEAAEYSKLIGNMDTSFGFVAFSESSLLSTGEYLFLRKIKDINRFRTDLNKLSERGYAQTQGSSFLINSSVMAKLIGSELCSFKDFYLSLAGDVAVISKRRGLSESVNTDRLRRRVIYYDNDYAEARREMPEQASAFFWARSSEFHSFLKPFLLPANISASLFNRFDILALTFQKTDESTIDLTIRTSAKKGTDAPYRELWVTSLRDGSLTGPPIAGDIVGSSAKEVIFATSNGELMAVAGDGTIVMQATTMGAEPVGSPILYDWYGNGQPVILLAAGTRIYGWNQSGSLLPRFPIELNARITAPIVVTDVLRNGLPEIIAATDDRKIHILDRRGQNIEGWPQNVNAPISSEPLFAEVDGTFSIWAFSQNVLHSWLRNGNTRPGYPQFMNAGFNGSPIDYKNNIIGAATDGYIYSFGRYPTFSDSLSMQIKADSLVVKAVYAGNSELLSIGIDRSVLLRNEEGFFRSDLISTQSRNGSVFFFSPDGNLQLTQNLGQPASTTFHTRLMDINSDKNQDVVALADFGRLFAWDILTGERIYDLPTSGISYPLITDLNGDGQLELIGQTRDGLRSWTIFRAKK